MEKMELEKKWEEEWKKLDREEDEYEGVLRRDGDMREIKLRRNEEWVQGRYGIRYQMIGGEGVEGSEKKMEELCGRQKNDEMKQNKDERNGGEDKRSKKKNEQKKKILRAIKKIDDWVKGKSNGTARQVREVKMKLLIEVEGLTQEAAEKKMKQEENSLEWWEKKLRNGRKKQDGRGK